MKLDQKGRTNAPRRILWLLVPSRWLNFIGRGTLWVAATALKVGFGLTSGHLGCLLSSSF